MIRPTLEVLHGCGLAEDRLDRLLEVGGPHGEVATAWRVKEVVRDFDNHRDPDFATVWIDTLSGDLQHADRPREIRQLGRTVTRWRDPIVAWHAAQVTNGPTESANQIINWQRSSGSSSASLSAPTA